jgi:predicted nucleic acid-binding protein
MDRLLSRKEVVGHDMVYGELLIGDRGSRRKHLASYEAIPRAATVPHRDVVDFVRSRDLQGRGVGWIDIHLLASAIVEKLYIWTADPRFATMARDLAVSYDVLGSNGRAS